MQTHIIHKLGKSNQNKFYKILETNWQGIKKHFFINPLFVFVFFFYFSFSFIICLIVLHLSFFICLVVFHLFFSFLLFYYYANQPFTITTHNFIISLFWKDKNKKIICKPPLHNNPHNVIIFLLKKTATSLLENYSILFIYLILFNPLTFSTSFYIFVFKFLLLVLFCFLPLLLSLWYPLV